MNATADTLAVIEMPSDASLLRRYVETGDRDAMGELFRRHGDTAYRLALRVTGNAADAEEAVQSAFLHLLSSGKQYRGDGSVVGWIARIVVNECKIRLRQEISRRRREDFCQVDLESVHMDDPAESELADAAKKAVAALPRHYRLPVWLYYLGGLGAREIAAQLSLNEETVRKRITRGIHQIRSAMPA